MESYIKVDISPDGAKADLHYNCTARQAAAAVVVLLQEFPEVEELIDFTASTLVKCLAILDIADVGGKRVKAIETGEL